jgi:hypothetical protein
MFCGCDSDGEGEKSAVKEYIVYDDQGYERQGSVCKYAGHTRQINDNERDYRPLRNTNGNARAYTKLTTRT